MMCVAGAGLAGLRLTAKRAGAAEAIKILEITKGEGVFTYTEV